MWQVIYDNTALKQLKKLSRPIQADIYRYMQERIATAYDPRRFGKALQYEMKGLWRYRVGDYRIVCRIENHKLIVLVIDIDHRKDVYG